MNFLLEVVSVALQNAHKEKREQKVSAHLPFFVFQIIILSLGWD